MPRTPLRMPKMSMTMEEGELSVWRVAVGDDVDEGQVVCEVLTDKVDMEVEAPARGTVVELAVDEGASVAVGTPIAWIETESASLVEDLFGAPPEAAGATGNSSATPAPQARGVPAGDTSVAERQAHPPEDLPDVDRDTLPAEASPPGMHDQTGLHDQTGVRDARPGPALAIPQARRLAARHGVDLATVSGSGPGGAVLVSDLLAHLASPPPAPPSAGAPEPAHAPAPALAPAPAAAPEPAPAPEPAHALAVPSPAGGAAPASSDLQWRARADALAPRDAVPLAGAILRHEVVLGRAGAVSAPEGFLATLLAAVGSALAASGPLAARGRPRVAVAVPTPAGVVPLTVTSPHTLARPELEELVAQGLQQARAGHVDVRFLPPPDAVVTWLPELDEAVVPPAPPAALAVAAGRVAPRVVAVGDAVGVRTTVRLSAVGVPGLDTGALAAVLATIAAALGA